MQSRRALLAAKADFDAQNTLLLQELPRLYDSRIEYFQPSLQAFVSAQVIVIHAVCFLQNFNMQNLEGGNAEMLTIFRQFN